MADRPQKITSAEMRDIGVRDVRPDDPQDDPPMRGDNWPDDMRLSDLEPRLVCSACGKRGAGARPDFNWNKPTVPMPHCA